MCVLGVIGYLIGTVFGLATPDTTAPHKAGEGCVAVYGASCSYRARQAGSIHAAGTDWRVDIVRAERTIRYGPDDFADADDGIVVARDVIRHGDRVRAVTSDMAPPYFGLVSVGKPLNDR